MAQPSSRVCAFDATYRFYLRSSPIVCAFDLLGLILRFLTLLCNTRSFRKAIYLTIETLEIRIESDPFSVQALERVPFLRLVIAVLAIVQAIKLLGCSGIPWTLTWMYGYLIPYCTYEVLGIFGKWCQEDGRRTTEVDAGSERIKKYTEILDMVLGVLAIALQFIVMVIAFDKWGRLWGENEIAMLIFGAVYGCFIGITGFLISFLIVTVSWPAVKIGFGDCETVKNWGIITLILIPTGMCFGGPLFFP